MRDLTNAYKIQSENPDGRDLLEDLGVDGRILLKYCDGYGGYASRIGRSSSDD
jgi:hypothetical protein